MVSYEHVRAFYIVLNLILSHKKELPAVESDTTPGTVLVTYEWIKNIF
jgi:hypothetical protein